MKNLKLYYLRYNNEDDSFESGSLQETKGVEVNDYSGIVSWSYPKVALRLNSYRVINNAAYFATDSSLNEDNIYATLKDTLMSEYNREINRYTELRATLVNFN
mgnify:FL=1